MSQTLNDRPSSGTTDSGKIQSIILFFDFHSQLDGLSSGNTIARFSFLYMLQKIWNYPFELLASSAMWNFPLLKMGIERQYNSNHHIASYIDMAIGDCHEILPKLHQLIQNDSHSSEKEIHWLIHTLATRVLFQYTIDNWDHLYYSRYDFPNKKTHQNPDEGSEN